MKKIIIPVFSVFVILFIASIVYNSTLIDINNETDVLKAIKKTNATISNNQLYQQYNTNDVGDTLNHIDYKIVKNGNFSAIFYDTASTNNIIVLEESKVPFHKYKYYGYSISGNKDGISKYKTKDTVNGKDVFIFAIQINQLNDRQINSIQVVNNLSDDKLDSDEELDSDETLESIHVDQYPFRYLYIYESDKNNDINIEYQLMHDNQLIYSY